VKEGSKGGKEIQEGRKEEIEDRKDMNCVEDRSGEGKKGRFNKRQ
jgi:hypothetical protein